jgi:citrate synthase
MTSATDTPRGLKGVIVTDTLIGEVRGEEGFYHYREYSATDLARSRPFEDVVQLLLDGQLPTTTADRERFADTWRQQRVLPDVVVEALPSIAAVSQPLDGLRTALSLAGAARGCRPVLDLSPDERRQDAIALAAMTPTILCALHRLAHGLSPIEPRDDLDTAANHLWMLTGELPSRECAAAIDTYLVSTIDHGFNASTFTARVVASTGADVASALVAALGALSGPLHGGAPSRALDLLDAIGTADRIDEVVRPLIGRGERVMGFGHAVYRTDDPRSLMLRDVALSLGGPLVDLAVAVEDRIVQVLAELKPGRSLRTNVEYYAGVVMDRCGIAPSMFTPTFASSRVVGWCAHVLEQAEDGHIIRPSARYVGTEPPVPVPALADR